MSPQAEVTAPGNYGKRLLVCSVGLSPQVVTETLYALAVLPERRFVPTSLHLVTTQGGAPGLETGLLRPDGALDAMARDWQLPHISVLARQAQVHIVPSQDGDMSAEDDLAAFARYAATLLRQLTADDDAAVHVSLSGGRKSAAAAWALAMALYGRAQDRLSHVLVEEGFSNHPGFFYPTPFSAPLLGSQGRVLDAQDAKLRLSMLPFPRLRAYAPADFIDFNAGVEVLQQAIDRVRLTVDLDTKTLKWGAAAFRLAPSLMALLAVLADDLLAGGSGLPRLEQRATPFLAAYARLRGAVAAQRAARRLSDPLEPEWLEEKCSLINSAASRQGVRPRGMALVGRVGARPRSRYRLALDVAEVNWIGERLAA